MVVRTLFLRQILRRRVSSIRFPAPIPTEYEGTDEEGFALLKAAIERFEQPGEFQPHTILGPMSADQWLQFQLWHCEHHLSFLLPAEAEELSARGAAAETA